MSSSRPLPRHLGEMVSAYVDGELPPQERYEAESHLAGCNLCREELSDMMMVRARLRGLPMLESPLDLTRRNPTPGPVYRRPRVLVVAAAAAASMVLALAALAAPRDVVALSGQDFNMTYRARASLDQNQTGRLVPLESLLLDSDSGLNG